MWCMTVILKNAQGVNLVINHYDGGYQQEYLKKLGHKKALCIAVISSVWIKSA